jgi:hypothetical protein
VFGEDTSDYVLVDIHPERFAYLLYDFKAAKARVTLFWFNDCMDKFG